MSRERDPGISEIFYYFETHTDIANGRTVGRKIGVIQEIVIKKFLLTNQRIRDCLIYEPRLRGKSGATHKVEFVLFAPICVIQLGIGATFRLREPSLEISLKRVAEGRANIAVLTGEGAVAKPLGIEQSFSVVVVKKGVPRVLFIKLVAVSATECRVAVLDSARPLASLESKRVGAQRFSGSDKLGSGIQTIEKAKQTSLVAVDFDLEFNDKMLSQSPESVRRFRSFALLGNGVHWTDHDLSVLETYVDFTVQVKDSAIIRYSSFVGQLAAECGESFLSFFMSYFNGMTVAPPDAFEVDSNDFELLRPLVEPYVGMDLVELVCMQIPEYNVLSEKAIGSPMTNKPNRTGKR